MLRLPVATDLSDAARIIDDLGWAFVYPAPGGEQFECGLLERRHDGRWEYLRSASGVFCSRHDGMPEVVCVLRPEWRRTEDGYTSDPHTAAEWSEWQRAYIADRKGGRP